ncbi:MAG: ADP-ribosylglycohydrolase family protein [Pseudomonadota bacterium]
MPSLEARFLGALTGLATGDALGTTLEFSRPGSFEPITDMVGGGPFNLKPGQCTDDTAMALCLAESLVHSRGFDPVDQMRRYLLWYRDGHYSCKGYCFDIGGTTASALENFERTEDPWSGPVAPNTAGNGSLMRLAPVPLTFYRFPKLAVSRSADSSRTTHGALEAIDACRYFGGLLVGALQGADKATLLAPSFEPQQGLWAKSPLAPAIAAVAAGSFREKSPPEIRGTGYVVESLEAALWAFFTSDNFEEAVLRAVNLGADADTTGAICGQIAGAYYGIEAIPARWREKLCDRAALEQLAKGLFTLSAEISETGETKGKAERLHVTADE